MHEHAMKAVVTMLRDGNYKQGRNALTIIGGSYTKHCCLGVMMDMYLRTPGCKVETRLVQSSNDGILRMEYNGEKYVLTDEAQFHYGVATGGCDIRHPLMWCKSDLSREYMALTELNDSGFTFAQIADVMEYFWDVI